MDSEKLSVSFYCIGAVLIAIGTTTFLGARLARYIYRKKSEKRKILNEKWLKEFL